MILGRVGAGPHGRRKSNLPWAARCAHGLRHVNEGCTLSVDTISRGEVRGGQMRDWGAAIAALVAALSIPMLASAAEDNPRTYAPTPPASAYDWTVTLGAEGREEPL